MTGLIADTLQGDHYNNINFLPMLEKNAEVNELLNSIDIDLTGLSGVKAGTFLLSTLPVLVNGALF